MRLYVGFFLFSLSNALFAWNANGHALIAEIAMEYLPPSTKASISHYLGSDIDIRQASVWMDQFYQKRFKQMRKLHYINIPYGDQHFFPKLDGKNALSAIKYCFSVLNSHQSSYLEKKLALRVLVHVVADIHQPMHTICWYSKRFPNGDKGGNAWKMYKTNLHQYWDNAGGWLKGFNWKDESRFQQKKAELSSESCDWRHIALNPQEWANQSHDLAIKYAYFPPKSKSKMLKYQQTCQDISKVQIQIAACHLAAVLSKLSFQGAALA